jgi:hypothetical protein
MVGMFASTGELELAVLGLASLLSLFLSLSLTGILEAIVASSSAHTRVVEMTSDREPTSFARSRFYLSAYESIKGSRC